jgi:hypothetical protein
MMAMITGGPVPSRPVVEEVRKVEQAPAPAVPVAKIDLKPKAKKAVPSKAAVPEKPAKAKKKEAPAKKPVKAAPKKGKK